MMTKVEPTEPEKKVMTKVEQVEAKPGEATGDFSKKKGTRFDDLALVIWGIFCCYGFENMFVD